MDSGFFDDHPMLGSLFDFNHNGSLDGVEAGTMGLVGASLVGAMRRASEEANREDDASDWNNEAYGSDDRAAIEDYPARWDACDFEDIDTTSHKSVMRAIGDDSYLDDIESLVEEALNNGVRFSPGDIIEISDVIWDQDLLVRLISTSKPRFLQEDADELSPRWGPVELEYHEDAFDEEYNDGSTYHVNLPSEDW